MRRIKSNVTVKEMIMFTKIKSGVDYTLKVKALNQAFTQLAGYSFTTIRCSYVVIPWQS